MARGVPFRTDDGTLCPWAMLATVPFTPEAAFSGDASAAETFPQVCREDRFASGFNPSADPNRVVGSPRAGTDWIRGCS